MLLHAYLVFADASKHSGILYKYIPLPLKSFPSPLLQLEALHLFEKFQSVKETM